MGLIKFIVVALCIQKNCANIPSPARVRRCKERGGSDIHSIATTAAIVAERAAGVASLLKEIPFAGASLGCSTYFSKLQNRTTSQIEKNVSRIK